MRKLLETQEYHDVPSEVPEGTFIQLGKLMAIELWSLKAVAEFFNVSRQRAAKLVNRADFPPPDAIADTGRLWFPESVREFERTWERKPGRPRKNHP